MLLYKLLLFGFDCELGLFCLGIEIGLCIFIVVVLGNMCLCILFLWEVLDCDLIFFFSSLLKLIMLLLLDFKSEECWEDESFVFWVLLVVF